MISNERLEELIENEERNARVSNVPQAQAESQDMASLLTELKSIRQAATAGVEEVAAAIEAIVKDGENLNGCQFPFLNKRGVAAVRAELAAQAAELDRLRNGLTTQNNAVCQTLGKVLGYPRYCDDQENFPGATEANGVCVGEHVAESLASEMAEKYVALREKLVAAEVCLGGRDGDIIVGNVCIGDADDGCWTVENTAIGEVLCRNEEEDRLYEDWYSAYQAAIAAGWLPDSNNKGGK